MFRFSKTLDVITVFHNVSRPASVRVANFLQKASVELQETAAETPKATKDPEQRKSLREPFELEVTERPPTIEQLKTILGYSSTEKASNFVRDAKDCKDALKKFQEDEANFIRPVTVDWNRGKAVSGDNESQILQMLRT